MLGSVESDSPECQYKGAIPRVPPGAAEAQDSLGTDTCPEIPAFPVEEYEVPDTRLGEVSSALQ